MEIWKPDLRLIRRGTVDKVNALALYVSENPGRTASEIADALGWSIRIKENVIQKALLMGVVRAEYRFPRRKKRGARRRNEFFIGEWFRAALSSNEYAEREGV